MRGHSPRLPLRLLACLALLATAGAAGCATSPNRAPGDPLEPLNRRVFWFNEQFDRWLLEPAARGYDFVAPDRVQESVSNFFGNLRFPARFANNILQGKVDQAYLEIARFGVNTTLGLAGLFDPATRWGLEGRSEDFGQTLGVWGFGPGPYLVLPFLGPSNLRDTAALPIDSLATPYNYVLETPVLLGARAFQALNLRARYLEEIEENRAMAFDYYVFLRDAYLDLRANQIRDGELRTDRDEAEDLYYFPE